MAIANEFQQKIREFMEKNNMKSPAEYRMLDLVAEIGEVAKELCKMSCYGAKAPEFREEIIPELGDAFYSLIAVANHYNVDLLKALDIVLEKYRKRIEKAGHPGSGADGEGK